MMNTSINSGVFLLRPSSESFSLASGVQPFNVALTEVYKPFSAYQGLIENNVLKISLESGSKKIYKV